MFHYFTIKFYFSFFVFSFFFAWNFSLRFDLVIFASKRNTAKWNSSLFFLFFLFFRFFRFFRFFHLIFVSLRFFHLIFAYFTFVFASDFGVSHRSESCEIRLFFASKRNEIFASISNFASEAKVRAHPRPGTNLQWIYSFFPWYPSLAFCLWPRLFLWWYMVYQ